jgi:hypothetical protein
MTAMRTQLGSWRSSLCAALGLAAIACGGKTGGADEPSGLGGSGTGGSTGGTGGSAGGTGGSIGHAGSSSSGGIAGASGAGGSIGGAGGTPSVVLGCQNPTTVIGIDRADTGFVSCDAGFWHRPERRDCASVVPRPNPIDVPAGITVNCTRDQDCTAQPHGHCIVTERTFVSPSEAVCAYGCIRDEDCGSSSLICVCGDPVGRCEFAKCSTDADCGAGFGCASSNDTNGCGISVRGEFVCQLTGDQCAGAADCPGDYDNCRPGLMGRTCQSAGTCGRPFLVAGEPRLASRVARDAGWTAKVTPDIAPLDPASRAALAEHWSSSGLMEHASVAAFARFTLELLALGAPADLMRSAQQAMGDEIAHAELCFGLARAYAGHAVQPGPLPMGGALGELSFVTVVSNAIAEACIGETLAAVEASEACEHTGDPVVRAVLERIAVDEGRHAELGWKFLRWAIASAAPAVREQLRRLTSQLIATELQRTRNPVSSHTERDLLAYGVLTSGLRSEVRRAALDQLIAPLANTLFDGSASLDAPAPAGTVS